MNAIWWGIKRYLQITCWGILLWFLLYFFAGEYASIEFADRDFANIFPNILTFLAATSIYLLFVLWIKSKNKWYWILLKLLGGLIFGVLPFIVYYGVFYEQCTFWRKQHIKTEILYKNRSYYDEKIIAVTEKCSLNEITSLDTLKIRPFTPLFNVVTPIKQGELDDYIWIEE